jgi:hypothetical protein
MPMLSIYGELIALIDRLEAEGREYALCGGLALAVHGIPRATLDIDLVILATELDDVLRIGAALGFDVRAKPMTLGRGAVTMHRISKIDPESGDVLPLDLILVGDATREAWSQRLRVEWEGRHLSVISREGLISLKLLRGSGQDMDDIARLKEAS